MRYVLISKTKSQTSLQLSFLTWAMNVVPWLSKGLYRMKNLGALWNADLCLVFVACWGLQ